MEVCLRRHVVRASKSTHALVLGLALLAACDQENALPVASPTSAAALQPYVDGDAARALKSDGMFALGGPQNSGNTPMVGAERAGDLAVAYVRTFGPFLKDEFEKDRGAPINLNSLEVDSRISFAQTPYGAFPEGFHPAITRVFGPYYLVTLKSGSEPVLVVAVSAYTTDIGIDAKGELRMPWRSGNEFVPAAVSAPTRARWGYRPNLPEQAVAHVGRITGARTVRVPQLVQVSRRTHPAYALWRLDLDRGVTVRGTKGTRHENARALFVGPGNRLFVPASDQPAREEFEAPLLTGRTEAPRMGTVSLEIPHATKYEEVTVDEPTR